MLKKMYICKAFSRDAKMLTIIFTLIDSLQGGPICYFFTPSTTLESEIGCKKNFEKCHGVKYYLFSFFWLASEIIVLHVILSSLPLIFKVNNKLVYET